ncbi:hypothetical protein RND81_03G091400 [Saponaria officinalis]|uniref:No apical meristem-associated C-terminal domain-containing protein n=1 Tax=Saponaria officinalis TaxID=3572 RepID=A0AAW1M955_SAPOF
MEKKGTNQSKGDLWKTIMRLYEEAHEYAPSAIKQRTMKSLTSRWETINRYAKRDKASGISDEDVESHAHYLYQRKYNGVKFTLMHAWKEMKHLRKWQAGNTEVPSESGDEGENPRPDGIKKTKKKGKQAASSNVNMDAFTNAISEMNVGTSNRELLGIQMLEYQRGRDALFMFLLNKPHLKEDQKVMLANLKEKFNYMFK